MIFNTHTKLQEPAFSIRIEECVRQIIPIILWDFEGLVFDAVVKVLQAGEEKIKKVNSGGNASFCTERV